MYAGQLIEYIVTPVAGIPTRWVTEITHVSEKKYFVEEQWLGPYKLWHHQHFFREMDGYTQIEYKVDYQLPVSPVGKLIHNLMVKPKLDEIFSYRKKKLESLFGMTKARA